jgi:hypothetical protein
MVLSLVGDHPSNYPDQRHCNKGQGGGYGKLNTKMGCSAVATGGFLVVELTKPK